jgi:glucose-1-phosphate adenylyltransferase
MKRTLAMILAGGRGKRMDIFCLERPKPILPFAGKYRVIDITLSNCIYSQVENIAVLVDYQRSAIIEYLRQWNLTNIPTNGISTLQPKSGSYCGTADAVYQNLNYLERQDIDTVLILAGDHIYNMDYRSMLAFHREMEADATVGITRVPIREANRFGTLTLETGGRIKKFIEKSSTPVSDLASMGIYVFDRRFLIEQLWKDAQNPNSPHDFGYSILPEIIKQERVFGYLFRGYWQDIGTVESYYQANMRLLEEQPGLDFSDTRPVLTIEGGAGNSIANVPGKIANSLIGNGCIIDGYVENSILSPGVKIEEKAEVVNSIVMADTRIRFHSIIDRCILDEGVEIDRFCHIGFGTASLPKVNDITLVGKDVSLGPETAIGRKSKVMPGAKLYGLNYKFVAPGSIIPMPV